MFSENLLMIIKENYYDKSKDIVSDLSKLNISLASLRDDIACDIKDLLDSTDYGKTEELTGYHKEISKWIKANERIIKELDKSGLEKIIDQNSIKSTVNTEDREPHNLYEDYTGKKPYAFSIESKYRKVSTWKEFLIEVANYLYEKDYKIFESFLEDDSMHGIKRKYFSKNIEDIEEGKLVEGSDIYIITRLSANSIRDLVKAMIEKYSIGTRELQIYLDE